jgi:hypothetical protein
MTAQLLLAEFQSLNASGWVIMGLSIGSVLILSAFCYYRVMTMPPADATDHLKAPLDIDTRDHEEMR